MINANNHQVEQINWINLSVTNVPIHCFAKFRYRQPDIAVKVTFLNNNIAKVTSDTKVRALICDQLAVFYQGDICLGPDIITEFY